MLLYLDFFKLVISLFVDKCSALTDGSFQVVSKPKKIFAKRQTKGLVQLIVNALNEQIKHLAKFPAGMHSLTKKTI